MAGMNSRALVGRLDPELRAWKERPLITTYPSLVVAARDGHARVDGRVVSLGVLIVAAVSVYPIVYQVWLSLTDWYLLQNPAPVFAGLAGYLSLIHI